MVLTPLGDLNGEEATLIAVVTQLLRGLNFRTLACGFASVFLNFAHGLRPGVNISRLGFGRCGQESTDEAALGAAFQCVRYEHERRDQDYEKETCDEESRIRLSFFHHFLP